jgi:hypothetical protein
VIWDPTLPLGHGPKGRGTTKGSHRPFIIPNAAPPDYDSSAIALTVALALTLWLWLSDSGSLVSALALDFALRSSYPGASG